MTQSTFHLGFPSITIQMKATARHLHADVVSLFLLGADLLPFIKAVCRIRQRTCMAHCAGMGTKILGQRGWLVLQSRQCAGPKQKNQIMLVSLTAIRQKQPPISRLEAIENI